MLRENVSIKNCRNGPKQPCTAVNIASQIPSLMLQYLLNVSSKLYNV